MTEEKHPTLEKKLNKFADGCFQLAKAGLYFIVSILLFYFVFILVTTVY